MKQEGVLFFIFCFFLGSIFAADWQLLSYGPWSGREGVMGVSFNGAVYLAGGRGSLGFGFLNDVWRTTDGIDWVQVTSSAPWAERGYHIIVEHSNCIYLMGGQNFATFFNDVWRTCDGVEWIQVISQAPWAVRAGLAAVSWNGKLVVTGGSYQTTPFSPRTFYNDVWVSENGTEWEVASLDAGYAPCSGPRLVVHKNSLFLLGGEDGFSVDTQYNHVWSSLDSYTWKYLTNATWSPRSGHGAVSDGQNIYVLAGYLDLHDLWSSPDGLTWTLLSNTTFNCNEQSCGRYDFWSLIHQNKLVVFGGTAAWSTFGLMFDETWSLPL